MCLGRREVIGTGFVDADFCDNAVVNQVEQIGSNLGVRWQAKKRLMLTRFLGAAPIHAIAELGYMAGNRGRDDHVAVFPRPNRLFDSPSGANRKLGRLDIIKRHKLRGLLGGHHGFVL